MTIRLTRSFLLAAGLLLLGLLLAATPWTLATTRLDATSKAESYRVGFSAGQVLVPGSEIDVYVSGDRFLEPALRPALAAAVGRLAGYTEVRELVSLTDAVGSAVLVVEITRTSGVWTPLLAWGDLALTASYASDGATAWRTERPVQIASAADPILRVRTPTSVRALTAGLLPWWGYQRRLAELVAERVASDLRAEIARSAGVY